MEESLSGEADSSSANHEIPHILGDLKMHHGVHNSPPFVSVLRQVDPVHGGSSLYYYYYYYYYYPIQLYTNVSTPKLSMQFFSPRYVLHALRTVYFLTWQLE